VRTIVHVSDLHFGAIDEALVPPLIDAIRAACPDVTAISGDLTQRAHPREFQDAARFISALPGNIIVVPGNHDMAFYNPLRRAAQRLKLFRELITNDPEPWLHDEEIAVLGLNTARVSHLRDGRIREWQVRRIEERMATLTPGVLRVLVTHHPFDLPAIFPADELVGRAGRFMQRVVQHCDLMLAGHMHISHAGPTASRYDIAGQSAIFVQAGTAISTRSRGEANAFQVIRAGAGAVETTVWKWTGAAYTPADVSRFRKSGGAWQAVTSEG
jgi:3',5'-cyclic AMP phosphodiesterase CpdA